MDKSNIEFVYILAYVPRNAFDDERIILGIFTNLRTLKRAFIKDPFTSGKLYDANGKDRLPYSSEYYYYKKYPVNRLYYSVEEI